VVHPDDVRPRVLAHRLDQGLSVQLVHAGWPADQELLDVVDGDRKLLTGVVLNDNPPRGHVDDLAPGSLGRQLRQASGLSHDGLKGDITILSPGHLTGQQAGRKQGHEESKPKPPRVEHLSSSGHLARRVRQHGQLRGPRPAVIRASLALTVGRAHGKL